MPVLAGTGLGTGPDTDLSGTGDFGRCGLRNIRAHGLVLGPHERAGLARTTASVAQLSLMVMVVVVVVALVGLGRPNWATNGFGH